MTGAGESRTIDWAALSHALLPRRLRTRAITVSVRTDADVYHRGDPVAVEIDLRNRLPVPIRLRTDSPNVWTWTVDGEPVDARDVPDRPGSIHFDRGERKRFHRRWSQRVRVRDREWKPVEPGTYTIAARLSRGDAAARGLADRTAIEIVER
ncbi:hypothetical protein D8Y22_13480 [Salinadaptatus halalkaliphilus]|uniref:DUF7974 domain-containing protein n=1 Tax=Salinadaptatus halalkaliphilus TaxID=2419781 RepID=A0A4V3VL62_9EURY|nr:hypothetical protein [Salinadaptatus halalkaliphilus]THE64417.1 hypothetical protein D8Y22_13480 [Salinadaptatus halalkaliphilus]